VGSSVRRRQSWISLVLVAGAAVVADVAFDATEPVALDESAGAGVTDGAAA
jgi:hypothetical protein